MEQKVLGAKDFIRLANNFYTQKGIVADYNRILTDVDLFNFVGNNTGVLEKKYKVAFCYICINPAYWQYAKPMIEGARRFFLPGHSVDFLFWTDMPKIDDQEALKTAKQSLTKSITDRNRQNGVLDARIISQEVEDTYNLALESIKAAYATTVFPIEPIEWPMPTLLRYHTFLQQEEKLKEYDYVFYCDVDMVFAGVVGDEILANGLTAALHPMYALDKSMWPPYEPNEKSAAFIKRPGMVIVENNMPRFMPMYFAGGFQGGKADKWIEAMKVMKAAIDRDLENNYIAIWNDESHWNRYLFDNPPAVALSPSMIYPDSLIKEYYIPRWGTDYLPKLITLTKKQSLRKLSPQEFAQIRMMK